MCSRYGDKPDRRSASAGQFCQLSDRELHASKYGIRQSGRAGRTGTLGPCHGGVVLCVSSYAAEDEIRNVLASLSHSCHCVLLITIGCRAQRKISSSNNKWLSSPFLLRQSREMELYSTPRQEGKKKGQEVERLQGLVCHAASAADILPDVLQSSLTSSMSFQSSVLSRAPNSAARVGHKPIVIFSSLLSGFRDTLSPFRLQATFS
jgi:hypothetical protein